MATRLTPFSKFLMTALIVGGIGYALWYFANKTQIGKSLADKASETQNNADNPNAQLGNSDPDAIKVGVVTWGGYAGGEYFNEGFAPNPNSRYQKECGFKVDFKVLDDFVASREAFKADQVNLLWATVDALPTEMEGLKAFEPQIVFQSDWSRGGDAIVVSRGINKVSDLKGKKVAVALMTPSHSFLLWLLEASGMQPTDIQIVEAPSAIDAASYFKAQKVDAAVVWSPDDDDCIKSVPGSKILKNTKAASHIISDVFIAKKSYIDANKDKLKCLVEGWMRGAAEINTSEESKRKAAKILSEGLNQPEDYCYNAINNVRLCTYGDNANFFNLKGDYSGVKGEDIYSRMTEVYGKLGYAQNVPNWRLAANPAIVRSITTLTGKEHEAEGAAQFAPATAEMKTEEAFSTKNITINYETASATLSENAKRIIDLEFTPIVKAFGNARVRIEGNTDNVGDPAKNKALSLKRAEAVKGYLVQTYKLDPDRFIVIGNGADKPTADNSTEDGRAKNRRTDFSLLNE